VDDEKALSLVTRFLAGDADVLSELRVESEGRLSGLEQELVDAKVRVASELLEHGRREEALGELDRALELDPENYVIRNQRWVIRFPERFEPEIDSDWQNEQRAREREAERHSREAECGVDGCPIPQTPP
jgi:tetratricopeptide (TPR) repeat protein